MLTYWPMLILPATWIVLWAWSEVRLYRKGADVYEWIKKLDSLLKRVV